MASFPTACASLLGFALVPWLGLQSQTVPVPERSQAFILCYGLLGGMALGLVTLATHSKKLLQEA